MGRPFRSLAIGCIASASALVLESCTPPSGGLPTPDQPKLAGAQIVGHRVCGPFTTNEGTIAFACNALPTTAITGWQLTPLFRTNRTGLVENADLVLTVTTQAAASLSIQSQPASGGLYDQTQVAPGHTAYYLGPQGRVIVSQASNDGTTATWKLTMKFTACDDEGRVLISSVMGGKTSPFLLVFFLRNPTEIPSQCQYSAAGSDIEETNECFVQNGTRVCTGSNAVSPPAH